jgi:hypothetical protein
MQNKTKQYDDDDGRVICSMDVEGMRWHDQSVRRKERAERKTAHGDQMTRSEASRFNWYAILAGLVIASVFSVGWILFILFCTKVWFR